MDFFIKKNSTLPILKYKLTYDILEKYDITDEMLSNVAITFSMMSERTGIYEIANVGADLIINRNRPEYHDEVEYTLAYKFSIDETSSTGIYIGEFKIDFLNEEYCGKITLPLDETLYVVIQDSITKTTVL